MEQILFFNDTLKYGGTEILLIDILNHLSRKNCYKLTLLLPYPSSDDSLLKEISPDVDIIYIYDKRPSRFKKILFENLMSFCPRLHNKIAKLNLKKYDILVSFKDSIFSIIFSREKQRKILWIHNLPTLYKYEIQNISEYIPVKFLQIRIKRLILSFKRFDDVICVSQSCLDRYINIFNNGKKPQQRLQVLYNAINLEKTLQLSEKPYNHPQLQRPIFVMATRFSVEKRVDRVVKAAYKLKNEGYNFNIIIMGDGAYMDYVKKLISECSLDENIFLYGYVENPYPYIKQADWLISSSEKESFSLVILESIFLRTPVITTDCGGPSEIINNGEYGILTANSTIGIYEGMKKAMDFPDLSEMYISKSDKCLKRFNHEAWLNSIDQILNDII